MLEAFERVARPYHKGEDKPYSKELIVGPFDHANGGCQPYHLQPSLTSIPGTN